MTWILVVIEIIFALFCWILVIYFFQICSSISIKCVGIILSIILYLFHLMWILENLGLKILSLRNNCVEI
jgi:hypothetical protein